MEEKPKPEINNHRQQIEQELTKSENRRKNWQYAFGDGKLPYADFAKLMDEEMARVQVMEEQLAAMSEVAVAETPISKSEIIEAALNMKENWPYLERSTKKDFINTLFTRIVICKNEKEWSITQIE